jgi:hypothetical protein
VPPLGASPLAQLVAVERSSRVSTMTCSPARRSRTASAALGFEHEPCPGGTPSLPGMVLAPGISAVTRTRRQARPHTGATWLAQAMDDRGWSGPEWITRAGADPSSPRL